MAITKKQPSEWSELTIQTIADRTKKYVFEDEVNIHKEVGIWDDLPLGTEDTDPEVGDYVPVLNETGFWGFGTLRRRGLYRRSALTGTRAEQYGTTPYAGYAPWEDAIGERTYTEQNVVTDGESLTASIDALDVAIGDISTALDTINGEVL